MRNDVDTRIRAELRELADGAPGPVALADSALRLAGARRRRRAAAAATGIAAVVTVAVAGTLGVLPRSGPIGAAGSQPPPRPAAQQQTVVAYRLVDGRGGNPLADQSRLLDPATGRYVTVDVAYLYVSPDGSQVAAVDTDRAPTRIGLASRSALVARGTPAIRWLDLPATNFAGWSPDGRQVLIAARAGRDLRVLVVDGRSGRVVHDTRVPAGLLDPGTGFPYVWFSADGRNLVTTRSAAGSQPAIVRFLRLDGVTARQVTVPGARWLVAHPFPADGRHMLLAGLDGRELLVADTTTGDVVGRIPVGGESNLGVVGWYDDDHLIAARRTGGTGAPGSSAASGAAAPRLLLLDVLDLQGARVGTVPVPGAPAGRELEVGPAGAVPPGGVAPRF
jgi:hypothetical protein